MGVMVFGNLGEAVAWEGTFGFIDRLIVPKIPFFILQREKMI
jgi:hypothetical protein